MVEERTTYICEMCDKEFDEDNENAAYEHEEKCKKRCAKLFNTYSFVAYGCANNRIWVKEHIPLGDNMAFDTGMDIYENGRIGIQVEFRELTDDYNAPHLSIYMDNTKEQMLMSVRGGNGVGW